MSLARSRRARGGRFRTTGYGGDAGPDAAPREFFMAPGGERMRGSACTHAEHTSMRIVGGSKPMRRIGACVVAMACMLLQSSCASDRTTTRVDRDLILPPQADVLVVERNQRLIPPGIIDQPSPAYPALPADVVPRDVVVCVELVVGADGAVASMRQFAPEPTCESPTSRASALFFPAVAEAVRRWSFFGAAICTFVQAEAECDGDEADLDPVPMTLAYRFVFTRERTVHGATVER